MLLTSTYVISFLWKVKFLLTLCQPVSSADNLGKQLDPDQARRFIVGPDQDLNCLTF